MNEVAGIDEFVACPRCDKAPLIRGENHYRCTACEVDFPFVGGLPWLFAAPENVLGEWRNRLHFNLQKFGNDARRIKREMSAGSLADLTKRRLQLLLDATEQHRQDLKKLMTPVDLQSCEASYESHIALRTRLPPDQGLYTYFANVHRDWCWGGQENEASIGQLRQVLDAAGNDALGNLLVLGAGAGRLAYDIHQMLGPTRTIAVDFNPLLLFVARQITAGESLQLHEFPLAPRTLEVSAPLRTLRAPTPVRDGFFLLMADALRPPFTAHSFDTVVTPWLIDVVDDDFLTFAKRINRLLKTGGRWLNFGSLSFARAERRHCYSTEEVLVLVEHCGFSSPDVVQADIPYMCSPASRHGRTETVLTFAARKTEDVAAPARHRALPDWLVAGKSPVPLLPSFRTQALSTQIYSFVMSLIDGKRSIHDMAKLLAQQRLMSEAEAVPAIRQFLTRMYDDSQRQAGL